MNTIDQIKNHFEPTSFYKRYLGNARVIGTGNGWQKWMVLCPFHADKTVGTFHIHSESGAFNCFSCGARGGDIIAFHQKVNGLSFNETIKILKEELHPNEKEDIRVGVQR